LVGWNADKYGLVPFGDRSRCVHVTAWKRQERLLQPGFIGTGEITSSVVTGLSPSRITARRLKTRFKKAGTLRYNHIEFIRDRSLGQALKPGSAILHHWETLMPLFHRDNESG
jgi:hypothetical protein